MIVAVRYNAGNEKWEQLSFKPIRELASVKSGIGGSCFRRLHAKLVSAS